MNDDELKKQREGERQKMEYNAELFRRFVIPEPERQVAMKIDWGLVLWFLLMAGLAGLAVLYITGRQ